MKKYSYHLVGVILIIVTLGVAFLMISHKNEPQQEKEKESVLYVKTTKPEVKKIITEAHYRGRISTYSDVLIASEVSGKIEQGSIRLKAGTKFHKGDILFTVYSKDTRAKLKASKSSFLQILAKVLPDIKVDYPDQFEKWNTFFSQIKLDASLPPLPKFNSNKERIFMASQNVLYTYYNLYQDEITLTKYTVKAPFGGNIVSVSKQVGDITNNGATVANIIQTDKLEVTVPVLLVDRRWITKGDIVTLKTQSGVETKGTVVRMADNVDNDTQSVNIYIRIDNREKNFLMQGEYVDANFGGKEIEGMKVPREVIVGTSQIYSVGKE